MLPPCLSLRAKPPRRSQRAMRARPRQEAVAKANGEVSGRAVRNRNMTRGDAPARATPVMIPECVTPVRAVAAGTLPFWVMSSQGRPWHHLVWGLLKTLRRARSAPL